LSNVAHLRERISRGSTSARALTQSALEAAEKLNGQLNAFLEINRDAALKRADELDKEADGTSAPPALNGVPIAIKDNICVRGMQASCGSRILGNYQPPYNATAIERLLGAGVVVIGKTN